MTTQNDIIDILFLWALWALIGICVCVIVSYIIYRILRNPFQYPYFNRSFDVSRKRNVMVRIGSISKISKKILNSGSMIQRNISRHAD